MLGPWDQRQQVINDEQTNNPPVVRQRPYSPIIPPVDAPLLASNPDIADWCGPAATAWVNINRMAFSIERLRPIVAPTWCH
jgi:hypothetical protein